MKTYCPYCQTDFNAMKYFRYGPKIVRFAFDPLVMHTLDQCPKCQKPLHMTWTLTDIVEDKKEDDLV